MSRSTNSCLFCIAAGEYFKYGIVTPRIQAVGLDGSAKITCHSATKPSWFRYPSDHIYSTRTMYAIPHSKELNNSIYIRRIEGSVNDYHCEGTYLNGTIFIEQALVILGSK